MARVLIFNPGHEEALRTSVLQHYTPKREVLRMMYDLAPLMRSLAQEGDLLWRPDYAARNAGHLLDLDLRPVDPNECPSELTLHPWALEAHCLRDIASTLRKQYPNVQVISPDIPENYLALSHRKQAHGLLSELIRIGLADEELLPQWIDAGLGLDQALASVTRLVDDYQTNWPPLHALFAKRPFTSSGRGVQRIDLPISADKLLHLAASCVRSGSLSLEPYLEVVENWAMEYWSDGVGHITFVGLSSFETTGESGMYAGNNLHAPNVLEHKLANLVGAELIRQVMQHHILWLQHELSSVYRGYIGIDLLVYKDKKTSSLRLHPAVEINLRTTMGVLAHLIYERFVSPEAHGSFQTVYLPSQERRRYFDQLVQQHPAQYDRSGKIITGHYPLTPLESTTEFYAYIDLKRD